MTEPPTYRVRLEVNARDDIRRIHEWLVEQGAHDAADALVVALLEKIETLRDFPMRGPVVREFETLGFVDFRQIVMPPYRIVYEIAGDEVVILLVTDGRRDTRILIQRFMPGNRPGDQ